MNKKQTIQIIIIVLFFAASGFVLYKGGLFGGGQAALTQEIQTATTTSQDILPYGDAPLDTGFKSVIDATRFQYNIVQYPEVNAQSDVGIPESSLMSSLPSSN